MKTGATKQLIYAIVKYRGKQRTIKVVKSQLFVYKNGIKDHLIGNTYHDILTFNLLDIVREKGVCRIKPIVLTMSTFRHEPCRKKRKRSLYDR